LSYPKAKPIEPLSQSQLELIELRAHDLLKRYGVELKDEAALEQFHARGIRVDDNRVFPDLSDLHEFLESAPSQFMLHARNPERSVQVASGEQLFLPCYGAPNVRHLDGSKRLGKLADYRQLVSLAHESKGLGNTGWNLTFPHDLEKETMHLDMALAHLELSDKSFSGAIHSAQACQQVCDLTALSLGKDKLDKPYLLHMFNPMSPLSYPEKPLQSLKIAAKNNQVCVFASYLMMGMTSPVSLAASLAQAYAEVLTGAALVQLYNAASPVILGFYAIPFSMKTMLPNFSEGLSYLAQQIAAQLIRRRRLPVRVEAGLCTANTYDYQAAAEASLSTKSALDAQGDLVLQSTGWLESGRCIDIGKFQFEAQHLPNAHLGEQEALALTANTIATLKEQINLRKT